ncbi:MAG: ABC transporter permease [Bdellovibrionaceae bacterium]|nr:ABC transporter permease [Pseudobdellovibrionaceae bacterium]
MRPAAPRACFALLILTLILLNFPLVNMAVGAFRGPDGWDFAAFVGVLENPYWMDALVRSVWLGLASAVGSTLLGLLAALALANRRPGVLGAMMAAAMVMPEIVFALTLLLWFSALGLRLGLNTLILAHITFSVSFAFWILRSRLERLDPALFEAAADLGAGGWQTFRRVTLPLLLPSLGASCMLCFLLSFDDFLISFFVNGVGSDTLPIKLYSSMKTGMTNETNALAFLMSLISGLLVLWLSRTRILRGLLGSEQPTVKDDLVAIKIEV